MVSDRIATPGDEPLPLHELISQVLGDDDSSSPFVLNPLRGLGTMQSLNQRLAKQPLLDFINSLLRGIGQVIFLNNPISGFLILTALFIQSPWVGFLSLVGVTASTISAIALKLDRDSRRNGIFGYNGILVGAALGIFGLPGNGSGNLNWVVAVIVFAALTTVLMKTLGVWCATKLNVPFLTVPFNIATLLFLMIVSLPQPWFDLGTTATSSTSETFNGLRLLASLPIGFGQVFLADKLIAGILVLLAVAICTPIGAAVGILGCTLGVLSGWLLGFPLDTLYAGLWGYNALLGAMAIAGIFYAPNLRSLWIGAGCAVLCAVVGGMLGRLFSVWGLPILTVPFCLVTIGFFLVLKRSLPSLVPVSLHTVTSPEEHWYRYQAAKDVISNFRRQLQVAMGGKLAQFMLEQASESVKGDLRYIFDAIDGDRSGNLSTSELSKHLRASNQVTSEAELAYLFNCLDVDGSGAIDFEEFGELMLRHRRLMARYAEFRTYFLPIDMNGDNSISVDEMNLAMSSVGKLPTHYAHATCGALSQFIPRLRKQI
ncbi:MAG: urea transporter [Crinalium sp.]